MTRLAELPVLVLDAQATAASPRGSLVEIGWAQWPSAARQPGVTAHVVAPPPGAAMPRTVARLTGLGQGEWESGWPPDAAWHDLVRGAAAAGPAPVPLVVHFARFEEPFLRALHQRHGAGPFPFELVCTHAIARRLLPELPRRTLRALAGYFGAAVPELRRSADHVIATAFVWQHLVAALEEEGVARLVELREWLACPARRSARAYPLPRERRLQLPRGPGVYRLLRAGGAVVYVGKAACLRQRVSGHFHARGGERALEMLTQVRDVACTETATALEAALLETDEIKRLAPPYNRALASAGRSVWFATADLRHWRETPGERHTVGPLASPAPFEALDALRAAIAGAVPAPLAVRARAVGVDPGYAPPVGCFAEGLVRFAAEHGRLETAGAVHRAGARLWASRRDTSVGEAGAEAEPVAAAELGRTGPETPRRFAWDVEAVCEALEETVRRAAHAARRGRWLVRLCECSLAWDEPGRSERRLLVVERGAVAVRADLGPGESVPSPAGGGRSPAERRAGFDVATFDRLRVLTTELRTLVADATPVEIRLGENVRLSRRRLDTVLRWL